MNMLNTHTQTTPTTTSGWVELLVDGGAYKWEQHANERSVCEYQVKVAE